MLEALTITYSVTCICSGIPDMTQCDHPVGWYSWMASSNTLSGHLLSTYTQYVSSGSSVLSQYVCTGYGGSNGASRNTLHAVPHTHARTALHRYGVCYPGDPWYPLG